ncbi:MAG: formylmethanofuran dehydrogenase, subunit [Firmicutes bacterium]|nr:formylmethanofuran dehydrogenase, subunit [Bacillota bacterium]
MNKDLWDRCVNFHGHECPGLAIGFRACEIAKNKLNLSFSTDEEVVCVSENDACGVDAVQVITGCTAGKGNLLHKDTGKMAFLFFNRETGKTVRLILNQLPATMNREERQKYILEAPEDAVFTIGRPKFTVPEYARKFNTIVCEQCKEGAAEHKIRVHDGKKLCLDCAPDYEMHW